MKHFLLFSLICCTASIYAQDLDEVNTAEQAYAYARDHMWSEVQLLSKDECKWLMNPDRSKDPAEPQPGMVSEVRNSMYKLITDTQLVLIRCAVIDFDTRKMNEHTIDSIRNRMLTDYRRHGSFLQLAKDHLKPDEMYRYQSFRNYSGQIAEMLDVSLEDRKKGEVFFHELISNDFWFIIMIEEDPEVVDGYVVLKTRLTDN